MNTGFVWIAILGLAQAVPLDIAAPRGAAGRPRIEALEAELDTGRAVVGFKVVNGFSAESVEQIQSGFPVTFTHRIDFVARRPMFLLPSKLLLRVVVETRTEYDSLTKCYALSRTIYRKGDKKAGVAPHDEEQVCASSAQMREWMTRLTDLEIVDPSFPFPGKRVKMRVRSSLGRRYVASIFPSTRTASADLTLEL